MQKYFSLFVAFLFIGGIARSQNNYKEVTLPELMQKASKGGKGYIILDVRTPGEYMDTITGGRHVGIGRIKTAINISIQDLEQKPETIKQLEQYKNEDVYVICSHSYRSRRVSNLLLANGFASVNNVKGGMSEWYRNYDELKPYMKPALYENNISYTNLAPSQLYKKMAGNEPVEIIGLKSPPRFFFDTLQGPIYDFLPDIKNTTYYKLADSLQLLEKVKTANGKPVVIFGTIGGGTNDIVAWLVQKGFSNINMLAGSLTGYIEYMLNYQPRAKEKVLATKSNIQFFTPLSFCKERPVNMQWIDLRHDTAFNQLTRGTKLDYKTLKDAVNFPFYRSADEFARQFPDKNKVYIILPQDGYKGMELADALLKKGYRIGWLLGGIERWEWYTNNIVEFECKDQFIK